MKRHLKKIGIFIVLLLLIVALYCVYFYRENTMIEDVLYYTVNVDLDMENKKEPIVRISNLFGTKNIYEVRWDDGRKISRSNSDPFANFKVKGANLDSDQDIEIVTWFEHNASTSPDTVDCELAVFDLQPNGEYKELPLPRLEYDPDKKVGLDFQMIYQGQQSKEVALFKIKEVAIPHQGVWSIYLPNNEKIAEQLIDKFKFEQYTEDYDTPESSVTANLAIPRLGREPMLQLSQYIGEYKNELLYVYYWIRWREDGTYDVHGLYVGPSDKYTEYWHSLESN